MTSHCGSAPFKDIFKNVTSFPPQDPLRILLCRLCSMKFRHFVDKTDGDIIPKCRLLWWWIFDDWSVLDSSTLKKDKRRRDQLSGPTFLIPEFIFIILFSIMKSINCVSIDFYLKFKYIFVSVCFSASFSPAGIQTDNLSGSLTSL
ncbi:hypothetical protein ABVT39_027156 [Epinephelus coioides]